MEALKAKVLAEQDAHQIQLDTKVKEKRKQQVVWFKSVFITLQVDRAHVD